MSIETDIGHMKEIADARQQYFTITYDSREGEEWSVRFEYQSTSFGSTLEEALSKRLAGVVEESEEAVKDATMDLAHAQQVLAAAIAEREKKT